MEKILLVLAFLDCIIPSSLDPDEDAGGDPFVVREEHKKSGDTIGSSSRSITNYCSLFGLAPKALTSWEENQESRVDSTNPVAVPVGGKLTSSDVIRVGQESVESSPARAPASPLTISFPSAEEFRPPGGSASLCFRVRGVRLNVAAPSTVLGASTSQPECHFIDIEAATIPQHGGISRGPARTDLGKIFLGLTYQAVFGFVIFQYQAAGSSSYSQDGSPKLPPLLQIAEVSLVVGFAASLIGILLGQAYPRKAEMIEKLGSVASSISFFLMVSMVLRSVSQWICWLAAAVTLLAFALVSIKSKTD